MAAPPFSDGVLIADPAAGAGVGESKPSPILAMSQLTRRRREGPDSVTDAGKNMGMVPTIHLVVPPTPASRGAPDTAASIESERQQESKERYHSKNVRSASIEVELTPQEPSKIDNVQSEFGCRWKLHPLHIPSGLRLLLIPLVPTCGFTSIFILEIQANICKAGSRIFQAISFSVWQFSLGQRIQGWTKPSIGSITVGPHPQSDTAPVVCRGVESPHALHSAAPSAEPVTWVDLSRPLPTFTEVASTDSADYGRPRSTNLNPGKQTLPT
ncbi:hypothetical protein B0H13DRAFT_1931704 [Mycena leptocephala]|nr:hypothetical protein B0H13DRAFT_1931704 [Mycena leptocephala]